MANPRLRGGDAHVNLHSSDSDVRDSGDLLNGIGSASSLGSTESSVFSTNSSAVRSNARISGGAALTPLTQPSSSPSKPHSPFPVPRSSQHRYLTANPSHPRSSATSRGPSLQSTPHASPPHDRIQSKSRHVEKEGYRAAKLLEDADKLSKEDKNRHHGEVRGHFDNLLSLMKQYNGEKLLCTLSLTG